jgi:ParB/RepB/Spo0J family partition protein
MWNSGVIMPRPVKVDKTPDLPKFGDKIPVERFHISKMNIRADRPFGKSEKDKSLVENIRSNGIVEPMLARPEGNGFGIYAGERKYHSTMIIRYKTFLFGKDVLIKNVTDEQAREESLIEDLDALREELTPIERAQSIQRLIMSNVIGERAVAKRLGVGSSTISEWLKILDLTQPMQDVVDKGLIYYKDALTLAKMKPTEIQQEKLAKAAETQGRDGYLATLETIETGYAKRGAPAGKFIVERVTFERAHEQAKHDELDRRAKAMNMTVADYIKMRALEDVKA